MAEFDPVSALVGGGLIGIAAALLMLSTGRIAGISGIMGGVLGATAGDRLWRLAFLAGLIAAPLGLGLASRPAVEAQMSSNWLVIAAAGLLVGFGTRLAGGCTSGHGVCGMARLSRRSIVATVVFMASAVAVVALVRHVVGG